ncbi:hypothetical protein NE237_031813 [Protea cynaroides]|uniref:Peptidase A1 domain-containing protein n=1 Tax=Protea cynaroides TaxID=273540 RepID=A0A9Q0L339_9MAGN|nr:hypothetical protein NE237_031813 [Protea cynaroides]
MELSLWIVFATLPVAVARPELELHGMDQGLICECKRSRSFFSIPLFSLDFNFCNLLIIEASSLPTALLIPIIKDHSTLLYTTIFDQRSPLQPTKLVVDLGASFSWVPYEKNYHSSITYKSIFCNFSLSTTLKSFPCSNCYELPCPGCANNSCALFSYD